MTNLSRPKCLLVDDLAENLVALKAILADLDVDLITAKSGEEALNILLETEVALALLDVQMPEMDGFELAELMRGTELTKSVPIIFVTAAGNDLQREFKGYEAGAVDFLHKPLTSKIVQSKVKIFIELYRQKKLLQEALRVRDEFLSICSHELKTPLTSMKLQLQVINKRREKLGDERALAPLEMDRYLGQTGKSIDRIIHLVDDMLDVARVTSGKMSLNLRNVDLAELITEVGERFCNLLELSHCELTVSVPKELVTVFGDRFRLEQVIINLLSNAAKYAAEKPVHLKLSTSFSSAVVEVIDQGPGITEENQRKIFERFERTNEDPSITGLGIGLFISKQIIDLHKGNLSVTSALGVGSTFRVEIPLSKPFHQFPLK